MSSSLFRRAALERLSSPERLDTQMLVTSPQGWLALYVIALLLVGVLLWGVFGTIPTRVDGEGILIRGGMLREVRATGPGEVVALKIRVNDVVAAGGDIGTLARPDYDEEVRSAKGKLQQSRREASAGEAEDRATIAGLHTDMKSAESEIATYQVQLKSAREDLVIKQRSFEKGLITRSRVTAAERDIVSLQGRIASLEATRRGNLAQVRSIEQHIRSRYQSAESMRLDVTSLENQGSSAAQLKSPVDGRVVEVKKRLGDAVAAGDVVAVIEPESVDLTPVVYVTATTGKQIRSGMDAQVSPSTVKREEYGFMTGTIAYVGEYPVTPEAVRASMANDALASELIGENAKIEVRAMLERNSKTPSGYQWSSSSGPGFRILSGTRVTVSVVVDRRAPVTYVLPILKKAVGL